MTPFSQRGSVGETETGEFLEVTASSGRSPVSPGALSPHSTSACSLNTGGSRGSWVFLPPRKAKPSSPTAFEQDHSGPDVPPGSPALGPVCGGKQASGQLQHHIKRTGQRPGATCAQAPAGPGKNGSLCPGRRVAKSWRAQVQSSLGSPVAHQHPSMGQQGEWGGGGLRGWVGSGTSLLQAGPTDHQGHLGAP